MLEQERKELEEKRKAERLERIKAFDFEGEFFTVLTGIIYYIAWFFFIASVVGFATTMNMRCAASIIPFAGIVLYGMYKSN